MFRFIRRIYHKILNLLFEFDIGIYAIKNSEIPVNNITDLKYKEDVIVNTPKIQNIQYNNYDFSANKIKTYLSKSLLSSLLIRNFNSELYNSIKLKWENLKYLCITKSYNLNLDNCLNTKNEPVKFFSSNHKSLSSEICIAKSLRTIEEILELEPYTNNLQISKILKLPVIKYPVKKEVFTKNQLDIFRTKLAAEARCKKYSMTVENIFDKIPEGLYSEIELSKDNTINCTFSKHPQLGEFQFLVTGKRKYDTQTAKILVKYSDVCF